MSSRYYHNSSYFMHENHIRNLLCSLLHVTPTFNTFNSQLLVTGENIHTFNTAAAHVKLSPPDLLFTLVFVKCRKCKQRPTDAAAIQ